MDSLLLECKMCKTPIGYTPMPSVVCMICQYKKEMQESYAFVGIRFTPLGGGGGRSSRVL